MKKANRVLTAALAGLLLTAPASSMATAVNAADSYQMTVTVNTAQNRKAISPYIYGVNEYGNGARLPIEFTTSQQLSAPSTSPSLSTQLCGSM